MRISDWSSDVCSSDLPPGAHPDLWRRADADLDQSGGARARLSRQPGAMASLPRRRARMAGDAGAPLGAAAARPASRSEEHTSELQSLMRISYAVFCLKKKNNKYNKQKT